HLASCRAATAGTGGLDERLHLRERRLALAGQHGLGIDVRQPDRELVIRHRKALPLGVAPIAVDDRDRRSPVALAAEPPVLLAVSDGRLAEAALLERFPHLPPCVLGGETVVLPGVHEDTVFAEWLGPGLYRPEVPSVGGADDLLDGQPVGPGE